MEETIVKRKTKKIIEEVMEETPLASSGKIVNCTRVNVRKDPRINSESIWILNVGDTVMIASYLDDWTGIITTAGIEGYVMTQYVKEN